MALQESGEMYLEAIYVLSQKSPAVHSVDVAEYLGYSKPSVSRAVGLLKLSSLRFTSMTPESSLVTDITDRGNSGTKARVVGS